MTSTGIKGSSPWTLITTSQSKFATASHIRSVPDGWSGEVMIALPTKSLNRINNFLVIGSYKDFVSNRCRGLFITCWIMGFPQSSARTLPGKRVLA